MDKHIVGNVIWSVNLYGNNGFVHDFGINVMMYFDMSGIIVLELAKKDISLV